MKLQNIQDILRGSASPQLQQSPAPLMPMISMEEVYPDDFFEEDDAEVFDEQSEDPEFQANLAKDMSETYLDKLSSQFLGEIEEDEEDRRPWMDMITTAQEQIGIGEQSTYEEPFPGCSSAVFPIITKAQIQFQARALPEIYPNDPVKSVVIGDSTPELEAQADRVADVMNYQIQYQDKDNKKDFRKMLWWLPITGSAFRYVSHDPLRNINIVRYVPAGDLIIPYASTSLQSAYRVSRRFKHSKNDIIKLQQIGFYRDIDLFSGNRSIDARVGDSDTDNAAQDLTDAADGFVRNPDSTSSGCNQICYDIYTYCDLEGYEDTFKGKPTGIALPYVFTIHEDSGKILAIRRNWDEDDEYKEKRVYFSHYKFQEGPGIYGSGLPHLIGSLQEASTGALRAFGDSMAFSLLQGGFKLKSAKLSGSNTVKPGTYLDVDMDTDDINKAIKPLNYPAPSPEALQYIALLKNEAEEIVSTTDIMTGNQSPVNAEVGSTLAIIEQATKVTSGQHQSLYESLSEEFEILARLNYDFLPEEDQFVIPGKSGMIRREDFNGKVSVIPTADPAVSSFQQRQALDQAAFQLSQSPDFRPFFRDNYYPLLRRILGNMKFPDMDAIIMSEEEFKQHQQQAAMQPPPPPPPEVIKANAAMQDAQTRAQVAQSNAQMDMEKMKLDQIESELKQQINEAQIRMDMAKMQLEAMNQKTSFQLEEKQMDMKNASDNKMIDARFLGSVSPTLMTASDSLATKQDTEALSDDGQKTQPPPQLTSQQQDLHNQAIEATKAHMDGMAGQSSSTPQAPVNPAKQNMLMQLMNKIRGR